jgi:hypothetical protein
MSKQHALTLLAGAGKFAPTGANLVAAGKVLNAQLALIREADPLIAKRAIFVGTALLMVKESLQHGQFGPWLEKNIDDLGRRQVAYYMKLALAALEETRVDQKALAALPVGEIESALTISKGPAGEFRKSVDAFVGDSSLADLLAEYCGKAKGGKKSKRSGGSDESAPADESVHEVTVQDRFNEIDDLLRRARKAASDKPVWMSFSKQQHADLKAAADQTAETITDLFVKTHGRKDR